MEVEMPENLPCLPRSMYSNSKCFNFLSNSNLTSASTKKFSEKQEKMHSDMDPRKQTLEQLRENLSRVNAVIRMGHIVANLPDKGLHLIEKKEKLEKEILFREDLKITEEKIQKLSLKCASETNERDPHSEKLCCFDKRPPRRFRPNISLRSNVYDDNNHVKDGAKLLDLPTSLNLQKEQETRTKEMQMMSKQHRIMGSMMLKVDEEESQSSSDGESHMYEVEFSEDESEELEEDIDPDKPGSSGSQKKKKAVTCRNKTDLRQDFHSDQLRASPVEYSLDVKKEPSEVEGEATATTKISEGAATPNMKSEEEMEDLRHD